MDLHFAKELRKKISSDENTKNVQDPVTPLVSREIRPGRETKNGTCADQMMKIDNDDIFIDIIRTVITDDTDMRVTIKCLVIKQVVLFCK